MSDGVKLATDVYLPDKGETPLSDRSCSARRTTRTATGRRPRPSLATATRSSCKTCAAGFASEGHHAIIFGNDGLGGEHQDGHDTIEWIAKQEWSDGKVVTYGRLGPGHRPEHGRSRRSRGPQGPGRQRGLLGLLPPGGVPGRRVAQGTARRLAQANEDGRREPAHLPGAHHLRRLLEEAQCRGPCRPGRCAGRLHRRLVRHLPPGHDQFVRRDPTVAAARTPAASASW